MLNISLPCPFRSRRHPALPGPRPEEGESPGEYQHKKTIASRDERGHQSRVARWWGERCRSAPIRNFDSVAQAQEAQAAQHETVGGSAGEGVNSTGTVR